MYAVLQAPFQAFFATAFDEIPLPSPEALSCPDRADVPSVLANFLH